ncbi:MAG TPA: His/Gly/Thr/Pro-type tRNA ligase C-terminal domain-containing protein, partial [Nitrososphaera sp.]
FGRKDIGATGAAGGIERIVMALQRQGIMKKSLKELVYVASTSDEVRTHAIEIVSTLRASGIAVDYDILGRALRKQLDDASIKGAALVVIVAPSEIAMGKVIIRSMKDGTESTKPVTDIAKSIHGMLRA